MPVERHGLSLLLAQPTGPLAGRFLVGEILGSEPKGVQRDGRRHPGWPEVPMGKGVDEEPLVEGAEVEPPTIDEAVREVDRLVRSSPSRWIEVRALPAPRAYDRT